MKRGVLTGTGPRSWLWKGHSLAKFGTMLPSKRVMVAMGFVTSHRTVLEVGSSQDNVLGLQDGLWIFRNRGGGGVALD